MPGSPVDAALAKLASNGVPVTNAQKAAIEAQLGSPHGSWLSQYWDYLQNTAQFKFGRTFSYPTETVSHTILQALPWTLMLVGVTTIFAIIGGYSKGLTPEWSLSFLSDAFQHSILPGFVLVVTSLAGWVFGMRNNMINTLGEDYVTFAEANGLRTRTIAVLYAARNALLPNVTAFGLSLGAVVGGSVLVEGVFSYPGLGNLLYIAVSNHDFT